LRPKIFSALMAVFLAASPSFAAPTKEPPPPPDVQVPFGCGYTFPISQTHNVGSHLRNDAWAWDFRMPVGTPVTAARDGVVRAARGDSKEGGCDPKFAPQANYVVVDHRDGYETQYLHFSEVVVKPGQAVKAGQLLGYSGETGWACGAHLHFKVARYLSGGWNNPSVPAKLVVYGDPALESVVAAPTCDGGQHPFIAARPAPVTPESSDVAVASGKPSAPAGLGAANKPEEAAVPSVLKASDTSQADTAGHPALETRTPSL
jgi:murein DD-endopeptidase MepM/ murein hydrolase activator NlpD